jgi:hypothetical protein
MDALDVVTIDTPIGDLHTNTALAQWHHPETMRPVERDHQWQQCVQDTALKRGSAGLVQ